MKHAALVVGLGNVGLGYDLNTSSIDSVRTHSRAFSLHDSFSLVGAVDPSDARRQVFESCYGKPAYASLVDALANHQPAVVAVATPTNHYDTIRVVLDKSSPKIILCEKPISWSYEDAHKIIELCKKNNTELFINYIRRAEPAVMSIKKFIDCRKINRPIKGTIWYRGGFLNNGSHFFDLLEFWFGPKNNIKLLSNAKRYENHDYEVDLVVEFDNAVFVFFASCSDKLLPPNMELSSPSGHLSYAEGGRHINWRPTEESGGALSEAEFASELHLYQFHVANQLALALDGGETYLCTGRQSLDHLERFETAIGF